MKSLTLLSLCLLLFSSTAIAQVMGNYNTQQPTNAVNYRPQFRAVPRTAAFAPNTCEMEFTINALSNQVNKPTLRFYNAIPFNDYDLVLNPDVLAPTAQFTYSMKVKFILPEEKKPVPAPEPVIKTVTEHTYFYLTPEGKVVPLPLGTAK